MQEEKNRIERVLGAISSPDLIQRVLTFSLSVCCARSESLPHTLIVSGEIPFYSEDLGNKTPAPSGRRCRLMYVSTDRVGKILATKLTLMEHRVYDCKTSTP